MDAAALGLAYTVEFSGDLTAWEPSTATPAVLASSGSYEIVSVPYPALAGGLPARFFRVRVTLAP